jgi:hypothetical protein
MWTSSSTAWRAASSGVWCGKAALQVAGSPRPFEALELCLPHRAVVDVEQLDRSRLARTVFVDPDDRLLAAAMYPLLRSRATA